MIPSSQILAHPTAIRLLLNPQIFECFEKLMQAEYSVGQLAHVLERTVGQVFYRVKKLLEHDLIVVTRTEARAGRAVQYYRSSAPTRLLVTVLGIKDGPWPRSHLDDVVVLAPVWLCVSHPTQTE